ncbi:MAG: hypothetical protein L3J88_05060 [Gammaproteobacteria bacterium]|nr:hypothetical protein [Gammaproteobacteria bacterium]MCF6362709.1 hypothetical protein [Gammaproteobacteria bacterium]
MSIFHEIRFHGRGGQGTVSAAALMALVASEDGFESLRRFPNLVPADTQWDTERAMQGMRHGRGGYTPSIPASEAMNNNA